MDFLQTLTIMFCGLGSLALIIFLVFNLNQDKSRVYLAFFLFGLIYSTFHATLLVSGVMTSFPHFYRTALPFILIIGPSIYFYVQSVMKPTKHLGKSFLVHLIPAILVFITYIPFYLSSREEKLEQLFQLSSRETIFYQNQGVIPIWVIYLFVIVSGFAYCTVSLVVSYRTRQENSGVSRSWITVICVFCMLAYVLFALAFKSETPEAFAYFAYAYAIISFILVINLYMRPNILYGYKLKHKEQIPERSELLPAEKLKSYADIVKKYMDEEEPYLDPGMNLGKMADETGIPRNQLSWVINQHFGMNFNEFVNNYRIDHIIRNYSKNNFQQLTMEGIAHEVGFRSRNTFILAVKRRSGKTPSEYFR